MIKRIHLLCSTNWNPRGAEQMLAPLRTMLTHLAQEGHQLTKLVLIKGPRDEDNEFCSLIVREMDEHAGFCVLVDDEASAKIARHVSEAAEQAAQSQSELWVDLTPGPKQRAAVIFAAGSAVPGVKVVYSEQVAPGQFQVRHVDRLDSYNDWLAPHGILIRNYCQELFDIAIEAQRADRGGSAEIISLSISDALGSTTPLTTSFLSPKANLLHLAEWTAKDALPQRLLNMAGSTNAWNDDTIRDLPHEKLRAAARASQMVLQLRHLLAHRKPGFEPDYHDVVALLDGLSFLAARLQSQGDRPAEEIHSEMMFIAVDGDDVGRSFEERLAECVSDEQVAALQHWSHRVQQDLSKSMIELIEKWDASFLARTGDGFLAAFPSRHFQTLSAQYRPALPGAAAAVTTGIGATVKEAYLALKLGKACNRGGGLYFSLDPSKEQILWHSASELPGQ